MKGRIINLLLVFALSFSASGCWSRREINDLAIIMAAAVDKAEEEGKVRLAVQIVKPEMIGKKKGDSNSGSTEEAFWVAASTGNTVYDAERMLTAHVPRSLFWSHCRAVIIGEDLAREGVAQILDFFDRRHDMRRRMWFLIAKGEARDTLEVHRYIEKTSGNALHMLLQHAYDHSKGYYISDINQFLKRLSSKGTHPAAARVETVHGGGGGEKEKETELKLTGTAVFKADRLIGWLDETETRGLLWVMGKAERGVIPVPCPAHDKQDDKVSLMTMRAKSKIVPVICDDKVAITVEIEVEGDIGAQDCQENLATPDKIASLNKRYAEAVRKEVLKALNKAKDEYKVDIFGFGEAVMRKYPRVWEKLEKKWNDEVFPTIEVNIKVKANVRRTGISSEPTTKR
ncbi:Spore germination protein B3 [Koleobacter methoxysyntrophicus]|uniref:Spore germination protein B3 n=1 Tax=Koleobacter methoxysyntrophicus TaxID=2751313 RepID=A0A8A0RHL8_9FIRM|nr:Ger(x)C family spore germination protein [Koleobacter methoxysyntrophicus]QSQ07971.1 Spore germination protein B3 [Koleobacter methoxysyntrophicus]